MRGGSTIVKQKGRRGSEPFSASKLEHSLVAACMSAGAAHGQAELIAKKVTAEVVTWLEDRPEVTSDDLRQVAGTHLGRYHPDAGFLYERHRMTL